MASSNPQSVPRFQEMARLLGAQVRERGVELAEGAAEALLVRQISDTAPMLGLTEYELASTLTEPMITALADDIQRRAGAYLDAVTDTEPVTLGIATAGRIVGGMGMVIKLAARNAEALRTESMDIILSAADALASLGPEIRKAADDESRSFSFGGVHLSRTRQVLTDAIDLIRTGRWECPAGPHDGDDSGCPLTGMLSYELEFLGGWPNPPVAHD